VHTHVETWQGRMNVVFRMNHGWSGIARLSWRHACVFYEGVLLKCRPRKGAGYDMCLVVGTVQHAFEVHVLDTHTQKGSGAHGSHSVLVSVQCGMKNRHVSMFWLTKTC
jgi:hypothetical protein